MRSETNGRGDMPHSRQNFPALFQRAQCLDIQIIGRFVKQQQISAGFQHFSEMHAVALTPDRSPFFLLVAAAEIETPT